MPTPSPSNRSLRHRLKLAVVSFLGLLIPSACSPVTPPMCYVPPPPTDTPTPFVTCYTAPPPAETPTPTPFTSPISPLPTPTPASTAEARRLLLDRLLSEERFPDEVARDLESQSVRRHNWLQTTLLRWQRELAAEGAKLSDGRPARAGPYYILELTPHCTQDCLYCYNVWKQRPDLVTGELDTQGWCELIAKLQDEAGEMHPLNGVHPMDEITAGETHPNGCRYVTFSGGEPLLRDDFRDILAFCHRRGLESILITNGGLLDAGTLDFCLDHGVTMFELTLLGADAETHDRLTRTPGSWERALAAMTRLYKADAPWCGVFVATCENVDQTRQTLEMIVALGATAVMFNRFNPGGEGARHLDMMPTVEQVQDALAVVDEMAATYDLFATASIPIMPCLIDTNPYRHVGFGFCAAGQDNAYYTIGPDGRVRPCNHSGTVLGDLRTQSLAEILSGPELATFTAAAPSVCRPCPGLSTCRAGCRAAAEVCFGSLSEPEPWLRANLERLPPDPPTRHSSFDV